MGRRSLPRPPAPAPGLAACTIISKNYLAYARVLADSFIEHHPGVPFFVLLADANHGHIDPSRERFTLLELDQLPIPELPRLCFQYSIVELNTAVKPYLLSKLLDEYGLDKLLYFDPDILVADSLASLLATLERSSVVLIPHLTSPISDALKPSEIDILLSGTYNLGFLGLANTATTQALLAWWRERLYDRCLVAHDQGMFTDQRWMDLVPGFFDDVRILRDPGYNVAYWNLHDRSVRIMGERILINNQPAYFFHFSGLNLENIEAISKHQNRFTLDALGDLREIYSHYRDRVLAAGHELTRNLPYSFDFFDNGLPIPAAARSLYRSLGTDARRFGDPFQTGSPGSFFRWLTAPVDEDPKSAEAPITRLWYEVYCRRHDLRQAFPDVFVHHRGAFLRWAASTGLQEEGIDPALLPRPRIQLPAPDRLGGYWEGEFGVNVAGYFRSEKGMGEAVRSDVRCLEAIGIPYVMNDFVDSGSLNREGECSASSDENPYAFNLVHVNADQTPAFVTKWEQRYFQGRYNIGFWTWELSDFPEEWRTSFDYFDEIWVPSTFTLDSVSRAADKPVLRIPHTIELSPRVGHWNRAHFGLPEGSFLFLFMFDAHSFLARKNPEGLLDAFKRAFSPREPVALVLKTSHSNSAPAEFRALREEAAGANVHFVDGVLSRAETNTLMSLADAYVSLHRSEGFGLTMAEAMALGKPVIATGYSGNLDFMTPSNSFLVDYGLTEIDEDHGPYRKGFRWAEPDVEHAAELMRRVSEDPQAAGERGRRARADITAHLAPERVGTVLKRRLEMIRTSLEERARAERSSLRVSSRAGDRISYLQLVRRIRELVVEQLPAGSTVAVVSKGDDDLLQLGKRRGLHFPQNEGGQYAGYYPADSDEALDFLEAIRAKGASYLLFPSLALWWLDHYPGLRSYLETGCRLVINEAETCFVYALGETTRPIKVEADRYASICKRVRELAAATLPADAAALVVSKGDDELLRLDGRRTWHFPQDEIGAYAGCHPADSEHAIAELERLRRKGAQFLVLPSTAFWWLGYYIDFGRHLLERYRLVANDRDCMIYDLSQPARTRAGRVIRRVMTGRVES